MNKLIALAATAALLQGCATVPQQLNGLADTELCQQHGNVRERGPGEALPRLRAELVKRKLVADSEWDAIGGGRVNVGMSQCAMYASMGTPRRENRSVGNYGVHIQHVYRVGVMYPSTVYVYTRNGAVSSWQD